MAYYNIVTMAYHCTTSVQLNRLPAKIFEPNDDTTATRLAPPRAVPLPLPLAVSAGVSSDCCCCCCCWWWCWCWTQPSKGLSIVTVPLAGPAAVIVRHCPTPGPSSTIKVVPTTGSVFTVSQRNFSSTAPPPAAAAPAAAVVGRLLSSLMLPTGVLADADADAVAERIVAVPHSPLPSVVSVSLCTQFCSAPCS
eukprot:COSAG06_NODE_4551_length_4155_cov_2.586785_5_plen_194_part_00